MRASKPCWWLLYATVPLMIVLLIGESRMTFSPAIHQAAEIGIVLLVFGLMALWVQVNRAGLAAEDAAHEDAAPIDPSDEKEMPFAETFIAAADPKLLRDTDEMNERVTVYGPSPSRTRYN